MINQAIILAGGPGTRLRSAVPDLPKCMAPVNGKPFIGYLIDHFLARGIDRFIFALGYKSEAFEGYLRKIFGPACETAPPSVSGSTPAIPSVSGFAPATPGLPSYQLSIEPEPLGTGGAIRLACRHAGDPNVLVANGDTLFRIDPAALAAFHDKHQADCTLSLKAMCNADHGGSGNSRSDPGQAPRYGIVELDAGGRINRFREKHAHTGGLINGGVYALNRERFLGLDLPEKFSFETDYLGCLPASGEEEAVSSDKDSRRLYGLVQDAWFIDIGTPTDYERAQTEMKNYAI